MVPSFLTATGIFIPPFCVKNQDLVVAYNQYAQFFNLENAASIDVGQVAAKLRSDDDFILRHSGILQRYYVTAEGVLDPDVMCPLLPEIDEEHTSLMAEMGKNAALDALHQASVQGHEVDLIIVAASNVQRAYPALAIEIQDLLGASGLAFDLCGAECSAVMAMQLASQAIACGTATKALIISPEIGSAQTDFRDRETHFLLGDACSALLVENIAKTDALEIVNFNIASQFSNQIRNNFGFLNRLAPDSLYSKDKLFHQTPPSFPAIADAICTHLQQHLTELKLPLADVTQYFLQPTNRVLNQLIAEQLLTDVTEKRVPDCVAQYGGTGAAGLGLSFHLHQQLSASDYCVWVAFGAGFSVASMVLKKC
ncbi:beta-ketoacyl-ACP synthase III [Motilimonas cestriensis]|uniref:Beta-ketoacyl-ACP synthase III n=1 Tax=Motilimonas cestriensis TaxID=2742685 RepID=A0ABS8W531_9GAMM|nr:beta-ketoacyl-ACP synthase III [Motilimonas cestriensis]MCE2593400.1 beta-ketoacyl-ACP synthase III [Motilimonas cestriensis]